MLKLTRNQIALLIIGNFNKFHCAIISLQFANAKQIVVNFTLRLFEGDPGTGEWLFTYNDNYVEIINMIFNEIYRLIGKIVTVIYISKSLPTFASKHATMFCQIVFRKKSTEYDILGQQRGVKKH